MPDSTPHPLPIEELRRKMQSWLNVAKDGWSLPMDAISVRLVLSRLSELESLRAEAVKALEPFADIGALVQPERPDSFPLYDYDDGSPVGIAMTAGDFRLAASTLALLRGKGEDDA